MRYFALLFVALLFCSIALAQEPPVVPPRPEQPRQKTEDELKLEEEALKAAAQQNEMKELQAKIDLLLKQAEEAKAKGDEKLAKKSLAEADALNKKLAQLASALQPKEPAKPEEPGKPAEPEKPADELEWLGTVAEGVKKAGENGGTILVLFTDPPNCGPCRELEAKTFPDEKVKEFLKKFILVMPKLGGTGDADARKFSITSVPTFIFLDAKGKELSRRIGFMAPEKLIEEFSAILDADKNIEEGDKKIKEKPEDPAGYKQAIKGYRAKTKLDKVIEYYNKLIELDPKNEKGFGAEAYENLAKTYEHKRLLKEAVETMQKLIDLDPDNEKGLKADALEKLADIYSRSYRLDKAVETAEKIMKLDPENKKGLLVKAYDMLTGYYGMLKNMKKALEYAEKIVEADPDNKWEKGLEAAFQLSRYYIYQKDAEKIKKYFEIVKKMDPEDEKGYAVGIVYQQALFSINQGTKEKTKEYLDKIKEMDPEDDKGYALGVLFQEAKYAVSKDDLETAMKDLDAIRKMDPKDEKECALGVALDIGRYYISKGDAENANKLFGIVREIDPQDKKGFSDGMDLSLAIIPGIKEKWDEAIKNLKAFIESHKDSKVLPRAYWYLAGAYSKSDGEEDSKKTLKEIIEKFPDSVEAKWAKQQLGAMK